jgi:hypothetical protein
MGKGSKSKIAITVHRNCHQSAAPVPYVFIPAPANAVCRALNLDLWWKAEGRTRACDADTVTMVAFVFPECSCSSHSRHIFTTHQHLVHLVSDACRLLRMLLLSLGVRGENSTAPYIMAPFDLLFHDDPAGIFKQIAESSNPMPVEICSPLSISPLKYPAPHRDAGGNL